MNPNTKPPKRSFLESYFFYPSLWHKALSFCLLPFSCIYALITITQKLLSPRKHFDMKIISIGNLVSGGSGKTPFCIALVQYLSSQGYTDIYIILRGYKRKRKGYLQVSENGVILCDVTQSGDEAMLLAMQTKANVVVSENRKTALQRAQKNGARIVILDDGYRFCLNKFDILLEPALTPFFPFVLPSGYYRLPQYFYKKCDLHLKEGIHYKRKVALSYPSNTQETRTTQAHDIKNARFLLATAIANPSRLQPFLPDAIIHSYYLPDHATFDSTTLQKLLEAHNATHILMTQKDYVKCAHFALPIALLSLTMEIDSHIFHAIESFLQNE